MRRVIRAFQVEYRNSRKRRRLQADTSFRLETVASVFGASVPPSVAEAARKMQFPEQAPKICVMEERVR